MKPLMNPNAPSLSSLGIDIDIDIGKEIFHVVGLVPKFLRAAFAKVEDSEFRQEARDFDVDVFRHRNQQDGISSSSRPAALRALAMLCPIAPAAPNRPTFPAFSMTTP